MLISNCRVRTSDIYHHYVTVMFIVLLRII